MLANALALVISRILPELESTTKTEGYFSRSIAPLAARKKQSRGTRLWIHFDLIENCRFFMIFKSHKN